MPLKLNEHIIRDIIGAGIDLRNKVLQTPGDPIPPVAITFCGRRIVLHNRQRIKRAGDGDVTLLCDECLSNLPVIAD